MATYIDQTRASATWTNQSENSASLTNQLRHGTEPTINDMADLTFEDPLYKGGAAIKDLTFSELAGQTWTSQNKN